MHNFNQANSPAHKSHHYPFKSVSTYKKQLSQNEFKDEIVISPHCKVNTSNGKESPINDHSNFHGSRFTFETQTKYASRSLRESTSQAVTALQGENSNNFLKPEEREVGKLLTDGPSTLQPLESSIQRSRDPLASSGFRGNRHSISHMPSLSQIQDKDPFAFKKVTDHWNYKSRETKRSKLSHSALKQRPSESQNAFGYDIDHSQEEHYKLRSTPVKMNKFLLKKIRSNSTIEKLMNFSVNKSINERKPRNLPPLPEKVNNTINPGDNSPNTNRTLADEKELSYINPEDDLMKILAHAKGSEVVDLEDMPFSKRTHDIQEVNNQVNYIINSGRCEEALNALDSNTQEDESYSFRRLKEMRRSLSYAVLKSKNMKSYDQKEFELKREKDFMSQKSKGLPIKKKNHYNKWFVPVEYWKVVKEQSYKDTKCEELKKNIFFIYNNIHNYSKKDFNPLSGKPFKGVQQIRYEAAQEKLTQNPIVHRMKKMFSDNNMRMPKILKSIKSEKVSDL